MALFLHRGSCRQRRQHRQWHRWQQQQQQALLHAEQLAAQAQLLQNDTQTTRTTALLHQVMFGSLAR